MRWHALRETAAQAAKHKPWPWAMHWYVSLSLERRVTFRAGVVAGTLVALALAVAACGADGQDENEAAQVRNHAEADCAQAMSG